MPAFPKPSFTFNFDLPTEIGHLLAHKTKRQIPAKSDDHLLLASWNIANLGLQKRWDEHYQLLAEIISWFDIVALQEVNDNLTGLRAIDNYLPDYYRFLFSDKGGNNERAAFVYDARRVALLEKVGELSIPPSDYEDITLPNNPTAFTGFDRNPYLAAFECRNFTFLLLNVHLYFGSEKAADIQRRSLETYALARYADLRRRSKYAFTPNIIALGDFNLPMAQKGDPVFDALTARGLQVPEHSTRVYSNIVDDAQYDQIAFFPGLKSKIQTHGVFDFDGAIFPTLWQASPANFRTYLRYYLSDHRLIWMQLGL